MIKEVRRKQFIGMVVSDKMQKTVVVSVEMPKRHPLYSKMIKNTRRFKAHNEIGAKKGDKVRIEECRPISKDKSFIVVKVLGEE
ncbi:30S ribosomal protein S17 [candidate division WWE3 bacterium RIFCSPHIGHO2_01_FULL_40_23]|uniref:Small ribosomal subunit protein uS17 n=1 Tax=candidate division WWE3 bacterium RIFCSPLOWO2_01_FULL_41_18 TaxID=1802625 RepID=A0A1F4VEN7_UNCKA|nr:MAG: 30S ribosomal protein S17 [candidate division WWE3 bacterium RIFCSPHIGHO2_01_FULL_40_23]OGC55163.1 MAG: 30S ribosomal protein S17 [candidate division WWE3 bacterium RIFCSPLOWO2_01_FULL_41_18]